MLNSKSNKCIEVFSIWTLKVLPKVFKVICYQLNCSEKTYQVQTYVFFQCFQIHVPDSGVISWDCLIYPNIIYQIYSIHSVFLNYYYAYFTMPCNLYKIYVIITYGVFLNILCNILPYEYTCNISKYNISNTYRVSMNNI